MEMRREVGSHYVIVGRSERREYFKENDGMVSMRAKGVLVAWLHPIDCVGEVREGREAGRRGGVGVWQVGVCRVGLSANDLLKTVGAEVLSVDAVPRNQLGKIQRNDLRKMLVDLSRPQ